MKKAFLFILSISVAFGITYYTKKKSYSVGANNAREWKTFVKKSDRKVSSHKTTPHEFEQARIRPQASVSGRQPASTATDKPNPHKGFSVRNNRILTGDVDQKYEDENTELVMVNMPNPDWKEVMGNDLMRFQDEETKLLVKEEVPVIKIQDGKGRYLEQVTITYLTKDGDRNSFKALVDSDSGSIVETWDRTIHEKAHKKSSGMRMPASNNSGIIAR